MGRDRRNPQQNVNDVLAQVQSMDMDKIQDMMAEMQKMAQKNPEAVRSLLQKHIPFLYALVQSMIMLSMLSPQAAYQIVPQLDKNYTPVQRAPAHPPASGRMYPPQQQGRGQYQNPPAHPPAQNPEQQKLLQKILSLTPQQIDELQESERRQVMAIRAQYGQPNAHRRY